MAAIGSKYGFCWFRGSWPPNARKLKRDASILGRRSRFCPRRRYGQQLKSNRDAKFAP
ncbi:hypothetical protein MHY1_00062 [Methylovirgula sp. HY1]|nr:hypothetical protein MHY1_00062 [Methylovirgula sp. HY1]